LKHVRTLLGILEVNYSASYIVMLLLLLLVLLTQNAERQICKWAH